MGTEHVREFWNRTERYHELARRFEQNITITHPAAVTGRSVGCGFCYHCGWCVTNVKYYEHRGEPI